MFKLLLADDDKLFLESVAATIEGELENIETTMAFDGMDALVKFDEIRHVMIRNYNVRPNLIKLNNGI